LRGAVFGFADAAFVRPAVAFCGPATREPFSTATAPFCAKSTFSS